MLKLIFLLGAYVCISRETVSIFQQIGFIPDFLLKNRLISKPALGSENCIEAKNPYKFIRKY